MSTQQSNNDKGLEAMICKNCYVALVYDHPSNPHYTKCIFCGHCVKREIKISIKML